jgi:hypothetical protein
MIGSLSCVSEPRELGASSTSLCVSRNDAVVAALRSKWGCRAGRGWTRKAPGTEEFPPARRGRSSGLRPALEHLPKLPLQQQAIARQIRRRPRPQRRTTGIEAFHTLTPQSAAVSQRRLSPPVATPVPGTGGTRHQSRSSSIRFRHQSDPSSHNATTTYAAASGRMGLLLNAIWITRRSGALSGIYRSLLTTGFTRHPYQ